MDLLNCCFVFAFSVTASPPKQVSIDQLVEAANSFYKMSLAHEITLDANFKVEKTPEDQEPP